MAATQIWPRWAQRATQTRGRGAPSMCPRGHSNGPKRTAQRIRLGCHIGDALKRQLHCRGAVITSRRASTMTRMSIETLLRSIL
jgi:hypothetical protein